MKIIPEENASYADPIEKIRYDLVIGKEIDVPAEILSIFNTMGIAWHPATGPTTIHVLTPECNMAWQPTSVDLMNNAGLGAIFDAIADLEELTIYRETIAVGIVVYACPALTSINFPNLITGPENWDIRENKALTTITMPNWIPQDKDEITFQGNALSAATVNSILALCVASAGFVSGVLDLGTADNEAPTGQGLIDAAALTGRGIVVTVVGGLP